MKKLAIGLLILLVILSLSSYVFIPGKLTASETILVNCTASGANRIISNESTWTRWWPGYNKSNRKINDSAFTYKEYSYKINKEVPDVLQISMQKEGTRFNSIFSIFLWGEDSAGIRWQTSLETSMNPVKRVQQYLQAKEIINNISEILEYLKQFLEKQENIYSMEIKKIRITDTVLTSTKKVFEKPPTMQERYDLINMLKTFIKNNGARETGHPILNVSELDSTHFQIIVAIPTDKVLTGKGNIVFKRLVPGFILTGDVRGGQATVDNALVQLDNYRKDYSMQTPALPFEVLVTDRTTEPDTLKWITKLCYPVY